MLYSCRILLTVPLPSGLTICGIDHKAHAEWATSHKIIVQLARVRLADRPEAETGADGRRYLQGPVLVTTASGGICHQTLQFTIDEEHRDESEGVHVPLGGPLNSNLAE